QPFPISHVILLQKPHILMRAYYLVNCSIPFSRLLFGDLVWLLRLTWLQVNDLLEASKTISTLPSMVELDIQKGTVRQAGSHTRNLLRVKRGIDMVKVLFEQILVTEGNSLKDAASKAYAQVFAPHHGWAIRKAVGAGMYALPSKSQLLKKLNEDENSARAQMQSFVRSSGPVILYVEDLFTSKNLGLDW
uniref:Glycolipid transfer protein domain-containing protein n=1 Tax=Aegilops tauschii subsp. strangulata TaxID=200361 RepID=A0A453LZV7_AEGTS